ncbi:MAG TPA: U32 family peptidase [Methanosarcinaceae archaeon]|nr:U32 family peptidase [Methanosarcinaceae archaeon]
MSQTTKTPLTSITPEILAPAGDRESLLAALKGGADAVYLGIRDFNARWGATNFELDELENAIDLAHSHDTKVFLALNIPVKQNEIQDALDIIDSAYSSGIDAIIMEDIGMLQIIREIYPDLKLHASTQMTIHNTSGVEFIEGIGADRVILSRELDTKELKAIVSNTSIEAEVFVHGALCYSYSGRCLFSSFISGRSANRGACAQPCRLRYRFMVNGRGVESTMPEMGEYPISCAELCTLSGIDEIVNTGVVSFKIEGRMKRGEYVTKSASAYKAAVEKLNNGGVLDKDEIKTDEKELAKLFYRGFTKGFILGNRGVTHPKYSSNYGVFLGKVADISHFRYTTSLRVKLREDIHTKDGVGIRTRTRMLGSAVNVIKRDEERVESAKSGEIVALEISSKTGKTVNIGDEVYLTTDRHLLNRLQETDLKRSPVKIKVTAKKDERLNIGIEGTTEDVVFEDDYIVQQAMKAPTTEEKIKTIIEKLGDTPYAAKSVDVVADEDLFIPIGVLTNAKREAADMLLQKTILGYKRERKNPQISGLDKLCSGRKEETETAAIAITPNSTNDRTKNTLLSVEVNNADSMIYATDAGADIVYVPIEQFSELKDQSNKERMKYLASKKEDGIEFVFIVPQITHDHELTLLRPLIEEVNNAGFGVACSNLGAVQIAKECSIPFVTQKELNTFNALTSCVFFGAGAHRVTLSSELNLDEICQICENLKKSRGNRQVEIVAHGRELLLVTENDLLKPLVDKKLLNSDNGTDNRRDSDVLLVDRKERRFPVKRLGTRTFIYNFEVLNMLNDVEKLKGSGADVLRLDLRLNTKREVKEITKAYRNTLMGKNNRIRGQQGDAYTKGQYFRGV